MKFLTLVPAYGRDYKTKKEVQAAWDAGKDFQISTMGPEDGRMINRQDVREPMQLNIRYKGLRNIHPVKASGNPEIQNLEAYTAGQK